MHTILIIVLVASGLLFSTNTKAYETHTDDLLDDYLNKNLAGFYPGVLKVNCDDLGHMESIGHTELYLVNNLDGSTGQKSPKRQLEMLIQDHVKKLSIKYSTFGSRPPYILNITIDIRDIYYFMDVAFLVRSHDSNVIQQKKEKNYRGVDGVKFAYQIAWYGGVRNSPHKKDIRVILEKLWLILDEFNNQFYIPRRNACNERIRGQKEVEENLLKLFREEREKLKNLRK